MRVLETEPEDLVYQIRKKAVDKSIEDFPTLGEFSTDQYAEESRSMGSVYVPRFKEHVKFSNIKGRAFRIYYRAGFAHEIAQAKRERRHIDVGKIIDNGLYLQAQMNGWAAVKYNETSLLGPLRQSPISKSPSFLERRRMKKQGGW